VTLKYEWVLHGIDGEQYFPGCGVSWTEFDHCVTGIGDTEREAGDDALDQAAQQGLDVPAGVEDEVAEFAAGPEACECQDECECEMHWYVSFRWREGPEITGILEPLSEEGWWILSFPGCGLAAQREYQSVQGCGIEVAEDDFGYAVFPAVSEEAACRGAHEDCAGIVEIDVRA
jgi:hypothetical protein